MDSSLHPPTRQPFLTQAEEDAKKMQKIVVEKCNKKGVDPPKYVLKELIGKGSFGRVYKARDLSSAVIVAVKIIDIDASDIMDPSNGDSYSEFLKEVNALKTLSQSGAQNINHVIEALPVGSTMWMITEYCGGGSIATLMKPTAPNGLQERWIIPILREVAVAIRWVHQAGIIHRDIKCANVLVTEDGGVQLCDFGVAGTIDTKLDKRSTFIGTPHWMAPELFDARPSYGKEVDIWAFGCMMYEIATGLPPNAGKVAIGDLPSYLKRNVPRLKGGNYSDGLRSLVAYCLEDKPSNRPSIENVQRHTYIQGTERQYPTSSLSELVVSFKIWTDRGGDRRSLFGLGGAQGPEDLSSTALSDDNWNFSTTLAFDERIPERPSEQVQDVINVYGNNVKFDFNMADKTPQQSRMMQAAPDSQKPRAKLARRRPPPEALAPLKAPLEKIFDPYTKSRYEDNSRNHYGRGTGMPPSDLPLRDNSGPMSIRDTLIDIGVHDPDSGMSSFPEMDTIRAGDHRQDDTHGYGGSSIHGSYDSQDFSRPSLSDPAEKADNRKTQDWKFPSAAPPLSADPDISRFPNNYEPNRPSVTPALGGRPALMHHPTEPVAVPQSMGSVSSSPDNRMSVTSMIDMDLAIPEPIRPPFAETTRPSTAASSVSDFSAVSETTGSTNPFEYERHPSLYFDSDTAPFVNDPDQEKQGKQDGDTRTQFDPFTTNSLAQNYPSWYLAEHPDLVAQNPPTQTIRPSPDHPQLDQPIAFGDERAFSTQSQTSRVFPPYEKPVYSEDRPIDEFLEVAQYNAPGHRPKHTRDPSYEVYDMDGPDDTGYQTSSSSSAPQGLDPHRFQGPSVKPPSPSLPSASFGEASNGYHALRNEGRDSKREELLRKWPKLPPPPSSAAMTGTATQEEMRQELVGMFDGLKLQLSTFREAYTDLPKGSERPPRRQ